MNLSRTSYSLDFYATITNEHSLNFPWQGICIIWVTLLLLTTTIFFCWVTTAFVGIPYIKKNPQMWRYSLHSGFLKLSIESGLVTCHPLRVALKRRQQQLRWEQARLEGGLQPCSSLETCSAFMGRDNTRGVQTDYQFFSNSYITIG